jgi:hypothetical protein
VADSRPIPDLSWRRPTQNLSAFRHLMGPRNGLLEALAGGGERYRCGAERTARLWADKGIVVSATSAIKPDRPPVWPPPPHPSGAVSESCYAARVQPLHDCHEARTELPLFRPDTWRKQEGSKISSRGQAYVGGLYRCCGPTFMIVVLRGDSWSDWSSDIC